MVQIKTMTVYGIAWLWDLNSLTALGHIWNEGTPFLLTCFFCLSISKSSKWFQATDLCGSSLQSGDNRWFSMPTAHRTLCLSDEGWGWIKTQAHNQISHQCQLLLHEGWMKWLSFFTEHVLTWLSAGIGAEQVGSLTAANDCCYLSKMFLTK